MKKRRFKLSKILKGYFDDRELNEIYISYFFRFFAISLVTIFVPIFLLIIGQSLIDISLYYLIYYASLTIFKFFSMHLISKIGVKKVMALGILTLTAYYPLLNLIDKGLPYQWPALVFGISVALYYSAFHLMFTKVSSKKKEGREFSVFKIIAIITGMICPLLGGLLIYKFSFNFVFITASSFLLIAIIPLFLSKDFKIPSKKFSMKEILKQDSKKKAIVYQFSAVLAIVSGIFWPIFIYLNLKNVIPLGIISSLTSFLMIFIILYIGRRADKNEEQTLRTGVFLNSPSWIIRLILLSPVGLFFANFYGVFSSSFIDISFQKIVYEKARKSRNRRDYFLFREFNLEIGRFAILIAVLIIGNLFWMFVLSFFVTFGYLILTRKHRRN